MRRIWSPWRSAYVGQEPSADAGCIFCRFADEDDDARNLVALRGEHAYVVLNRFPYNAGHLMVVPYRHTAAYGELPPETLAEMMALLGRCVRALDASYGPDGYNAGMNLGAAAGAGVADHLHLHAVPRWEGDTNFMPVLADVKVVPELLEETYRTIAEALRRTEPLANG